MADTIIDGLILDTEKTSLFFRLLSVTHLLYNRSMQKCNRTATVTYASRCCLLSEVQLRHSDCLPLTSVPKPRFAEPSPISHGNSPIYRWFTY